MQHCHFNYIQNSLFLTSLLFFLGPEEYCHRDTFNATCEPDEVVIMATARYGRMSVGRCVKRNLGYLGCAVDVLNILDSRCSGHNKCELKIIDDALYETQPCPEDTTAYLQASYVCRKGGSSEIQFFCTK